MKRLGRGLILLASALGMMGCSMTPESNSGPDQDRLGAIEIKLNDLVLDFVSCIDGDKTDWKFFTVPAAAKVQVAFAFDEAAAGGHIIIRKATGEELHDLRFKPGSRNIQVFDAVQSHYFLEISCEAYMSEYTVEVTLAQ